MISVSIAYAPTATMQLYKLLQLPEGSQVQDAIVHSGWQQAYPEMLTLPVGVFSRKVTQQTVLAEGDRVEIYRPLTVDPKVKRRVRATQKLGKKVK